MLRVLDLVLPNVDGIEVMQWIPELSDLRVIAWVAARKRWPNRHPSPEQVHRQPDQADSKDQEPRIGTPEPDGDVRARAWRFLCASRPLEPVSTLPATSANSHITQRGAD